MPTFRILHCLRAPVGGLFRHVRDLAREQARRGHAVGILCDTEGDALTEGRLAELAPDLVLGISRIPMPRDVGFADMTAVATTRDLARAFRADILHGHGAKGGAYARMAARSLRRRGIRAAAFYTPHGGSLHFSPSTPKGRIFMAAERWLARATEGLIFESRYAARAYVAGAGDPGCPTRVVHNGISPDELEPVHAVPDASDFVFVGELRHLKGVDLLLAAAEDIGRSRPCRVTIVGAGPDGAALEELARAKGLEASVTFAGAMPAREAFRLGRVLVMPSRAESLPYVALEAAGAGLPLIATDVGGVSEIVAGTDTRLVPPDNAAALADAMREVLDHPDAAKARARRLHAAIASRFSVSAMTDGVVAFYVSAAEARSVAVSADRAAA
ncbi:MAG: glycosyltransferase family 4 protein [Hyphomicrobiaceae bacterium]|nr:glycosyltransferase family 4 protein [Hyphomicrobiaceae bacterium]